MSELLQQLVFILSLILLYSPDNELIIFSPAIIASYIFLYLSAKIVIKDLVIVNLLILGILVIAINPMLEWKEIARLLFSVGCVLGLNYIKINSQKAFLPIFLFFLMELALRIYFGNLSELSIYAIKSGTGLFADSNFVGVILVFCVAGLIDSGNQEYKKIATLLFFLAMTFSRTAWLMLAVYLISKHNRKLGILLVIFAAVVPYYCVVNQIDVSSIDGSFASKIAIFKTFAYLLQTEPFSLLWGLGRTLPGEIGGAINGENYQGHTVFGQIVQYGLVLSFIFYFLAYRLSKWVSRNSFSYIVALLFGGFLGLSPTSYFGITLLVYGVFNRRIKGGLGNLPSPSIFDKKHKVVHETDNEQP